MDKIEVNSGFDYGFQVELRDSLGIITDFSIDDSLSCDVWSGDGTAVIFSPTATWKTVAAGQVSILVAANQTLTTERGIYPIRLRIATVGGQKIEGWEGLLSIKGGPGTSVGLKSYCTLTDILHHAGKIDDRFATDSDLAGFASQRAEAREWVNKCMIARARPMGFENFVRLAIDDDRIRIDSDIVKASSKYSASLIYERQITGSKDNPYSDLASKYRMDAEGIISTATISIARQAGGLPATDFRFQMGRIVVGSPLGLHVSRGRSEWQF